MTLKPYYNKTVNIVDDNNQVFNGIVTDYFYPEDNESEKESIVIETSGGDLYEFTEENINQITII